MALIASPYRIFTSEAITVDNTSGGVRLTLATVRGKPSVEKVMMQVRGAQISWLSDGTAPTATLGNFANPFDPIVLDTRSDIENFRAIRTGATSATLHVNYMAL